MREFFIQTVHTAPTPAANHATPMANNAHVAVETTADTSVLASLGINGQGFAIQLFNFTVVFLILWFLILRPLTKKMEERKTLIDESVDNAKKIETNLALSQRDYTEKIDEAKAEANRIVARATTEAVQAGESMKKKAKEEIETVVMQAKKNLEVDKQTMQAELRQETVNLVILALEKVLAEKMDTTKDKAFIENMIASLKS